MFSWIVSNLATIVICLVLAAVVCAVILSLLRAKKQGKTSCGCGCSGCPSAGICHKEKD